MKYNVKVIVNAKNSEIIECAKDLLGKNFLKIKVNKAPENGKANQEVIKIIAQHFKIKKSEIMIIKGETSTKKIIEIKH